MQNRRVFLSILSTLALTPFAPAQTSESHAATPVAATAPTSVPALVPYASSALAEDSKPLSGEVSMSFLVFKDEHGGEPLFAETQTVTIDSTGHYKVQLGAANPSGLPADLFSNGEARWLEVQIAGQKPQSRVLLSSVPYALKAADAATLGGLPASAFVLAGSQLSALATAGAAAVSPDASSGVTTPGGTANYVPLFTSGSTLANSQIYDAGTGVGIGDIPNKYAKLDVNGEMIMRGNMQVTRAGNATAAKGYPSYGFEFFSNAINSSTGKSDNPYFSLQSEPTGNNTAAPSATFNLLFANNGSAAAETGLYINPNGTIHFSPSQSFPGSVTSVAISPPSSDFNITSGPVTGSGTLSFAWTVAPSVGIVANAIVKRDGQGNAFANILSANQVDSYGPMFVAQSLTADGPASFAQTVGIGTTSPQAELNLNRNGTANADALLLGSTSSKGLQLRDDGTGVDIESIGVPLYQNFATFEPIYLNPNAGTVFVHDTTQAGPGDGTTLPALYVGANPNSTDGFPIGSADYSARFGGLVEIDGGVASPSVVTRMDHPLDPANKFLVHTAINSSEALNQYSGNVTTDDQGSATVLLPDWFEAENTDFRYQLTVISGQFAQAVIVQKVAGHRFVISTNVPRVEVSWLLTARRNDLYIKAHPMVAEQEKPINERGTYRHPELYGQPKQKTAAENARPLSH